MRSISRVFRAGALVIIILILHPLVGLVFADSSLTPASYDFISVDIPNPLGELGFTHFADINNGGEITGGFTNSSGFGFLIGGKFRSTDIQCPTRRRRDEPNAQPQSINKSAEIAGFCFTRGRLHGFFRNKQGKYTLLDFPGATLTEATGLNDNGHAVGDYRDSNGKFHGFFWDDGRFRTIDVPFPEATLTGPNGINNVGQIVGFYDDNTGGRHGFLYNRGNFISFDFPGALLTAPTEINDSGQIVGVYVANDGTLQSFLLDQHKFVTIDVPFPDAIFTDISGINNRGQIVGRYVESNSVDPLNPFPSHGFIATPEENRKDKRKPKPLVAIPNASLTLPWPQNVKELGHPLAKWRRLL
jgi:probable HAF family extracellular repeat protein